MPLGGTGAQRRLVLDETEHGAMLVQVGPPSIVENCDRCEVSSRYRPMADKDRVATIN